MKAPTGGQAGGLSPALSALFNVPVGRMCGRSGRGKPELTFPRPWRRGWAALRGFFAAPRGRGEEGPGSGPTLPAGISRPSLSREAGWQQLENQPGLAGEACVGRRAGGLSGVCVPPAGIHAEAPGQDCVVLVQLPACANLNFKTGLASWVLAGLLPASTLAGLGQCLRRGRGSVTGRLWGLNRREQMVSCKSPYGRALPWLVVGWGLLGAGVMCGCVRGPECLCVGHRECGNLCLSVNCVR